MTLKKLISKLLSQSESLKKIYFLKNFICNIYIDKNTYPNGLTKDDIMPAYKKDNPFDKFNYRPISILPVLSKAF